MDLAVDIKADATQYVRGLRAAWWSLWRYKWRVRLNAVWLAIKGAGRKQRGG